MRKVSRVVIAALFLQIFVTGVSAEAAPALRITAVSANGTQVKVSWTPQKLNAKDIYEVEFTKIATPKVIKSLKTRSTGIVAKLDPFSNYSVRVRQILAPKKWTASRAFKTTTDEVTGVEASNITTTTAILSWKPVSGATSYNLNANGKLLANTPNTTYIITGLTPGSVSEFSVTPVAGSIQGTGSQILSVTTLIDTPKVPIVSAITSNSATIKWAADVNASKYDLVVYDAKGTEEVLKRTVEGSLESTTLTSLLPLTSYTIGIKNVYGETSSKQSPLASFTTLKPAITNVLTSNVTTTSATLNWYPLSGALTYEVYRDGIMIPTATAALTANSVSYSFVGLSPGNTYKLAVRASYLDGNKQTVFTDFAEVNQPLLTDATFAPTSVQAPSIILPYASVPIVGATLTVSNGIWTGTPIITSFIYQWQRSIDNGTTWTNLAGQTGSTYKVVASDYAFKLRVRVTATNLNGPRVVNSAESGVVADSHNVQIPLIRGALVVGQLLEVTDGVWASDYPLTFRYQWNRDGVAITSQTSPSYTLVAADVDKPITVSVIAYSALGSVSASSNVRTSVAAAGNSVAPVVTGTVKVNETLTSSSGTWLNSPTITYQWQRSSDGIFWNNIPSATNSTYVVTVGDIGYFIRSQAFGTKTIAPTTYVFTASSLSTIAVSGAISTSAPVVSGSWTTGSTLSSSTGSWTSSGTFTYQWQRSADNSTWTSITGATSSSYVLTADDASKYVRVQVYLAGSSGSDGVAYSVPTAKVGAPYNTVAPAITGTLRVGVAQTVSNGTWSGSPTFTYQWQTSADGIAWANIAGATSASYTPTYTIANLRLRSVVSATNAVDTATATSQVVQGFLAPIATAIPAISGTVQSGQTLTTTDGTWPNTDSGYIYSWHRSSDNGVTWTSIGGATATTYVLVAGDIGYRIRSQVTVMTNAGSTTAYSLPTVAVAP